ncbi:MAG: hypothetical protein C0485_09900 [Pirellula sp.]|nr:hypothetical protein [Pirellula sp.]
MGVESIPYIQFQSLTGSTNGAEERGNPGCSWYASTDRQVVGQILIDVETEAWHYATTDLRLSRQRTKRSTGFVSFEAAEQSLIATMRRLVGQPSKQVTCVDAPPRLKY